MTIKVTYNVTDIYVSESVSATYINVSYEAPSGGGGAVWGDITGTLSNQLDLQAALDAKVPYNGATANVDLGEFELKAGQIEYDQTPTGTAGVAVTRWNDSTGTIETTLKGGSVVLEHGRDMFERVVNKTGIQLTKAAYQAVRVSNAQGQRLAVQLAQANNDNNSADTIGLVVETIDNNQEGYIYTVGEIDGVNTTGTLQGETWVDGDVLYLSPTTAGRITNIKPLAPQHLVVIGYVVYAHANNGKIYVKVMNGWELGELHDVDTTGAVAGNVLKYNGTIWTPSGDVGITSLNGLTATTQTFSLDTRGNDVAIVSSGSNHEFIFPSASATRRGVLTSADWLLFFNKQNALTNPVTGTGVSGQVAYWSGTNTQTGSNNLFWDNTNARLGIGTNAPASSLQIASAGTLATGIQFNNAGSIGYVFGDGVTMSIRAGATQGISIATSSTSLTQFNSSTGGFRIELTTLTNAPIYSYFADADTGIGRAAADTLTFFAGGERARITSGGNLLINSTTDSGQRLQVTGDTLLRGSGNTSATTALTVQNSDGTNMLRVLNNGLVRFGSSGSGFTINPTSGPSYALDLAGTNVAFGSATTTQDSSLGRFLFSGSILSRNTDNVTSGNVGLLSTFSPTLGNGRFFELLLQSTINQTGGANGITRGLYVNPTLTAAADWRSIEWSNNTGWGLYGAGTSNNYLNGALFVGGTTPLTTEKFGVYGSNAGLNHFARIYNLGTTLNTTSSIVLTTATSSGSPISSVIGSIGTDTVGNTALSFITGTSGVSSEKMRLDANGNLLVGATAPFSTEKFGVYGTNAGGILQMRVQNLGTTTNTSSQITFSTNTNGGFVASSNIVSLATDAVGSTALTFGNSTAGTFSEKMRITPLGNLHIGTFSSDSGERLQVTGTMKVTGAVALSNYLNGALSTNSTGVVTIEPSFSDLSLGESYAFDIQNYYVANGYTINPMDTGYQYARLLRSGQLRNATMLLIPQATKTSLLALNIPTADMSVVRATTATRVNKLGLVETVAANVARIDYTSNGDALLVEPQRTNIVQRSEDFANTYWLKSLGTLTSNAITAPDGTLTADLFTKTSAVNTVSRIYVTPYTTTGNHTFSIFIKQNVGNDVLFRFDGAGNAANFTFNFATRVLTNLGVISSSFQEFKNGWFRITATANVTNTGWQLDVLNLFPNATNDSVYVWGAQLEVASSMTSYIPTVAASVTRDADVITYSGLTGNSVITETFENATTNTITNPTTYTISQGRLKTAIRI